MNNNQNRHSNQKKWTAAIPIITVIVYFLLAYSLSEYAGYGGNGYIYALPVLIVVPFAPFISGLKKFRMAYPTFIILFYVLLCTILQVATSGAVKLWHPLWVLFLTIPIYYIFFGDKVVKQDFNDAIHDKQRKYKNGINVDDVDFDVDDDNKK